MVALIARLLQIILFDKHLGQSVQGCGLGGFVPGFGQQLQSAFEVLRSSWQVAIFLEDVAQLYFYDAGRVLVSHSVKDLRRFFQALFRSARSPIRSSTSPILPSSSPMTTL